MVSIQRSSNTLRNTITLITALFIGLLSANAQDNRILEKYLFHNFDVYDRDFNLIKSISLKDMTPLGLYMLIGLDEQKYICVTIGKDDIYEIQIVNIVKGEEIDNRKINMYQGGMHIADTIAVINVFVEYDTTKRTTTPECITIDVINSPHYIRLSGLIYSK